MGRKDAGRLVIVETADGYRVVKPHDGFTLRDAEIAMLDGCPFRVGNTVFAPHTAVTVSLEDGTDG